jgi:hypothetical protein
MVLLSSMVLVDARRGQSLWFSRFRCYLKFYRFGFDLFDFDRYDDFFRDDSFSIQSQTGIWTGAKEIAEQAKFLLADTSPFLETDDIDIELAFKQYNEDTGQCEFIILSDAEYGVEASTTDYAANFNVIIMFKLFFDFEDEYVPKLYTYIAAPFISFFFDDLLNSNKTRDYVCSLYTDTCSGFVSAVDNCAETMAALPTTEGALEKIDGNTQGCRAVHAGAVEADPENYCPHISFNQTVDTGKIFCQNSSRSDYTPGSLFDDADFDAYSVFAKKAGVYPSIGYDLNE